MKESRSFRIAASRSIDFFAEFSAWYLCIVSRKVTLRPFAIHPDLAKFAQAMDQVVLSFLAVGSTGAFAQTAVSPDTFVDMSDVTAIRAIALQ